MRLIRALAIGGFSGVIAGLLWGTGARLAMRVVAVMGEQTAEFSLGGTGIILLLGVYIGMALSLLYLVVRRWLPATRTTHALCFGLVVLVLLGYPFYAGPLQQESLPGRQELAIFMFGGLLMLAGSTLTLVHAYLDRVVPRVRQPWSTQISLAVLAVPVTLLIVMVIGIVGERLSSS